MFVHILLDIMLLTLSRLLYRVNINFTFTGKLKNLCDPLYCNIHFIYGGLELNLCYLQDMLVSGMHTHTHTNVFELCISFPSGFVSFISKMGYLKVPFKPSYSPSQS